jgi:hypothetical protein
VTTDRTEVLYIPPSPRGLVGDRWHVTHHCDTCHQAIPADQLITHARSHEATARRVPFPPPAPSD